RSIRLLASTALETSSPKGSPSDLNPVREPSRAPKILWGLLCRRPCVVPTFLGWVVLALGLAVALTFLIRGLHPFLAVNDSISDGLLVVEGWTPDYGLQTVLEEFKRNHYQKVYVTGGPLEYGMYLTPFKTYAHLGAATLMKLGMDSNVVEVVPAPWVRQD